MQNLHRIMNSIWLSLDYNGSTYALWKQQNKVEIIPPTASVQRFEKTQTFATETEVMPPVRRIFRYLTSSSTLLQFQVQTQPKLNRQTANFHVRKARSNAGT